ncbi:HNH endonuclease [Halomonas chromatireducens]|uniref:HNH nuclease domain-containing protein n=1 Tax=Halomonas chromatireducens TaxID=507626 RepID=A0A125R0Q1_9GAMM|nr:HNH endonuclease [Halomonas chromatireducens]AMD02479.1 hypothetical protein LOKO_03438 [Halomonas chromatireducens]
MNPALKSLTRLRVGQSKGAPASNKPCLILALICEIQAGHVASSRIPIDTRLVTRYCELYEIATGERQKANPWLPLWHLSSDAGPNGRLWAPVFHDKLEKIAKQFGQPKSMSDIEHRFVAADLDSALFRAAQDKPLAFEAAAVVIGQYFGHSPAAQQALHDYLGLAFSSGEYEKNPERLEEGVHEASQLQARSAAFRSLVLEAYDYRCAASRLRYISPDYRYLVEAAHLVPFTESQDDHPTNGLALTPNLHWAMDNHLIAPGPDHKWHVSPTIDALVSDNRWLCELDGHPLALPRDSRWHPAQGALTWRLDHLQR